MLRHWAIDSETFPIAPGRPAPRLVCVSWATRENGVLYKGLLNVKDGLDFYRQHLLLAAKGEEVLDFHNGFYDLSVAVAADPSLLPLIFAAYGTDAIRDTKERQKLIDLADGAMKFRADEDGEFVRQLYTLSRLSERHTGEALNKGADTWRLRYGELVDIPIDQWPVDAREYAMKDAEKTYVIREKQDETYSPVVNLGIVTDESSQLRAGWALRLQTLWGLRTDPEAVGKLQKQLEKASEEMFSALLQGDHYYRPFDPEKDLLEVGVCGVWEPETPENEDDEDRRRCIRDHGHGKSDVLKSKTFQRGAKAGMTEVSRSMKAIQARVVRGYVEQNRTPPETPKSSEDKRTFSTAEDTLRESGDRDLLVLAEGMYDEKLRTSYLPALINGTVMPLNPSYNLILETGRTSCPKPEEGRGINVQVFPRKAGARECVVPRARNLLVSIDYDQVELCSLGQIHIDLFSHSEMADRINQGIDLHVDLAAYLMGISYEEAIGMHKAKHPLMKEQRQLAKVPNFGFPGGMGPVKLVDFAKATYGLNISVPKGRELKEGYLGRNPTMKLYYDYIGQIAGQNSSGTITQHRSNRVRGGATFCQLCNTLFQGLAADGFKLALWRVAQACYLDESSPAFGSRPIASIHDELIAEVPEATAHEASFAIRDIMVAAMMEFIPDVNISATPALMRRWSKSADPVFIDGRLAVWEPKLKEKKKKVRVAA